MAAVVVAATVDGDVVAAVVEVGIADAEAARYLSS
jgi:hypothetical protein